MRKILGYLLVGVVLLCGLAACDNAPAQTEAQPEANTAQEEEAVTLDDILAEEWGQVRLSRNGRIYDETEQLVQFSAGTFADIQIIPNETVPSKLLEELENEEVVVQATADDESILTIIEGDTVLFRKPGTTDLHIDYSVGDISHSHTVRCAVTEDERTVGCDPMTIGDPDRILRLENGMTFMSSVSDRGSGRDRKLFIFNSDAEDPFASQNVQNIDLEYGAHGLCQVDGRVFFYSSNTIYALSEDFQTYKEVYDIDDHEIYNLFAIDDTLYAEIRNVTETLWLKLSVDGDTVGRIHNSSLPFEETGFSTVSYYNGTVHFIGTPVEVQVLGTPEHDYHGGEKNEYVMDLEDLMHFPCTGENFMNNYAGQTVLGDGVTYTLSINTPYLYQMTWGDRQPDEYADKVVEDKVGSFTLHDGTIYYTQLVPPKGSNSKVISMKLKSYDIATGTITELHSHDNFRDTYMTTDGRLYVLNNKLYYFTPTFNHHAFPVYDLGTGEVKYWCP